MKKQQKEIKSPEEMDSLLKYISSKAKEEREEKIRRNGLKDRVKEIDDIFELEKETEEGKRKGLLESMTKRRFRDSEEESRADLETKKKELEAQKKSLEASTRREYLQQKGLMSIEDYAEKMLIEVSDVMRGIESGQIPSYRSNLTGEVFCDVFVMGGGVRTEPLSF